MLSKPREQNALLTCTQSHPSESLLCSSTQLTTYGACTIGGNTAINAGLFFQPPASDFDLYFPDQWKSKDVAAAIAKVRAKQPFTDNPSANGKRYLQSGYTAAKEWLVDGAGYKNVSFNAEPDNKTKTFGHPEFNYEGGQRSGPVKTYLQPALQRSNFKLQSGAQVKRVIREGSHVSGVVVKIAGKESTIKIAKNGRVILSGGAMFSPQLLMLSGIGNPDELTGLASTGLLTLPSNVWINNTAVGDKLFDNPNTYIELSAPNVEAFTYNYTSPIEADKELYLSSRSGPYSFASETSAFWDVIVGPNGSRTGVQGTIDSSGFSSFTGRNTITLNVYGTSGVRSTTHVTLNKTTGAPGKAAPFFYTDPKGEDSLAVATFIHQLFASLKTNSGLEPLNIPQHASVAEIQKYITSTTPYTEGNVNHWSSSCRLGSCVDLNTKVIGMDNLFVVDASIIPPLTTNPVFGIMIAAERASELILSLH